MEHTRPKVRNASRRKDKRAGGLRRAGKHRTNNIGTSVDSSLPNAKVIELNRVTDELHKYKQMVDSANHGYAIMDMKGDILYVNDSFARMHGYNAGWLLGRNLKIFHNAEQMKYVKFVTNRLIKTGKGLNNEEIWHIHRNGTVFPKLMSTWLMKDKSGRPAMICATAVDISALKQREAELGASKKTLEAMLNASDDLVALMDKDLKYVDMNDNMVKGLGLPRKQLIGKYSLDLMEPDVAALRKARAKEVMATGKPVVFEHKSHGRIFNACCYPVSDAVGKITEMVVFAKDVTQQKKAEAELKASKKTLEAMLNASGDMIAMVDRDINLIDMNERMTDAFGLPRGKLIGRCAWDFMPPKVAAARRSIAEQVIATGKPRTFLTGDSEKGKFFSTSYYPLKGPDRKVTGMVVFAKDVTQQKKAEAELVASKKTLETMLNASSELIAMLDRDINFIDANELMADAMGLPREKLVGRCAWDFIPPKVAAARRLRAKQVIATGKPITFFDDGGRGKFFSTSYYPLKGPDGKVTGIVVFAKDVTQQKKAEAELVASKSTLETMLNASGDAIVMLDRDINFIEMNERMADAFGQPREKLIGRCAWDCMPPKAMALRRPKAEQILATGKPVTYLDEDDQGRIYSTTGYPLKGAGGKITGIVVFAKDVTQHKKAEAELNNCREELFKLRRSSYMDLFSAIIVHHFSQPLTIINMLVEEIVGELEGGSFEKERIIKSLKTCLRETEAAGKTIIKMREYTGRWIKGRIGHFSPCDVINKVVSSLESKARRSKIRIKVMVPESLPTIAGYRIAFEQIVLIITENAIEAADQKKWHQLIISAKQTNRHVELMFSNDCHGIPKENLGKIFEPFYSTKTNRVGKGLGLGLPIVHRILTTLGGEIRVKSAARKGTTFYVNWPLSY